MKFFIDESLKSKREQFRKHAETQRATLKSVIKAQSSKSRSKPRPIRTPFEKAGTKVK